MYHSYLLLQFSSPDAHAQKKVSAVHFEASLASLNPINKIQHAQLWAARMHVDGDGLRRLQVSTTGHGLKAIDDDMAHAAEADIFKKVIC